MRRLARRFLAPVTLLTVLALFVPAVQAADQCLPVSGTLYGWFTDAWHGGISLMLGRTKRTGTLLAQNTGFVNNGTVWRGTELWTIDFGKGDTIQIKTHFICEHVADAVSPSGVYHVTESGQIVGGTGAYINAYGSIMAAGPFGPSVKLPKDVTPPANATANWTSAGAGMICLSK